MNETQNEYSQESPEQDIFLGEKISPIWQRFCDWVWQRPKQGDGLLQPLLRGILRIIFIVARESQDDRITLRASALTFTVVLSLVPMLALGTAVLKGLGAGSQMRQAAYSFIEQFEPEVPEAAITPDASSRLDDHPAESTPPAYDQTEQESQTEE